jgi:hypothetical protein
MDRDGYHPTGNGFVLCGKVRFDESRVYVAECDVEKRMRLRYGDLPFEGAGGLPRGFNRVRVTVEYLE